MALDYKVEAVKKYIAMQSYFDKIIIPENRSYYSDYPVDFESDHRAKCPLHTEDTPSFRIYPEDNSFYCYGCGRGGDIIQLHREYIFISTNETVSFDDAVNFLYDYFINGKEADAQKKYNLDHEEEIEEVPLSSNYDLLKYNRIKERIERNFITKDDYSIKEKTYIYNLIDSTSLLVRNNLLSTAETLKIIKLDVLENLGIDIDTIK